MDLVGNFCKKNNCLLFVDAISGFLADEFSMTRYNIDVAITGSQKALSLPPSLSFIVLNEKAQNIVNQNKVRSMYFNLADYLKNGERGQTPFTPAVGSLIQLNEKLKRIEKNGGIKAENLKYSERAEYFRNKIQSLPFKIFTAPEDSSNCVTALMHTDPSVNAYSIFEVLKDEYKIWICPNGGDLKEKIFRVGHIGSISKKDINTLIKAFKALQKRGLI
jgi:aspartate aminotransferase-like enzyme